MKKIKYAIFLGTFMVPTVTTLAIAETAEQMEIITSIGDKVINQEELRETNQDITWEVIKNDLMIDKGLERYEMFLGNEVNQSMTYGKVAQIMCNYIGRAPISLPKKDGGSSGYIGRLVVEGIWGELPTDMNLLLTQKEWEGLCTRVKIFVLDPIAYGKNALNQLDQVKRNRITQYRLEEQRLGQLEGIELGEAILLETLMTYQEMPLSLYTYLEQDYISLQEMATLGLIVEETTEGIYIKKGGQPLQAMREKVYDKLKVSCNTKEVYMGNLKTYSLHADKDTLIPIQALRTYYDILEADGHFILIDKEEDSTKYLNVDKNFIINNTEETLQVQLTNLYWNGSDVIEENWDINHMKSGEIYPNYNKVYTLNNSKTYVTTVINRIKIDNEIIWDTIEDYGQANKGFLSHYTLQVQKREEAKKQLEIEATKELFPPAIIIGTMKYEVGPFKKGEQVEVYRADDGIHYYLHNGDKIVQVPWNSVKIPPNPRVEKSQATIEELEMYINNTGITSATNFLVWTDLYRQKTYVFHKQEGKWQIFKDKLTQNDKVDRPAILTCSTGHNITPTPRGTFKLRAYVPYFGVSKGYRCKNAVQIFEDYLYHSLIFDKAGNYLLEGKGVLGQRASQGCIRFSPEESEWFYNTMPLQTTVWIN